MKKSSEISGAHLGATKVCAGGATKVIDHQGDLGGL